VQKIIINNTINLLFKAAISILPISNHNCFRVLFDKIAFVYFIGKICSHFSIGNGQPREPALCQLYQRTFVPYEVNTYAETETLQVSTEIDDCLW